MRAFTTRLLRARGCLTSPTESLIDVLEPPALSIRCHALLIPLPETHACGYGSSIGCSSPSIDTSKRHSVGNTSCPQVSLRGFATAPLNSNQSSASSATSATSTQKVGKAPQGRVKSRGTLRSSLRLPGPRKEFLMDAPAPHIPALGTDILAHAIYLGASMHVHAHACM